MLTIKRIDKQDLVRFIPIEIQRGYDIEAIADFVVYGNEPHFYAFYDGENPVLLIGLKEKWPRVFDSFTIFSVYWKPAHYKDVLKKARAYLLDLDYDRIEHMVHCDRPWTEKMANAFGFSYCATLRKYANGKDYKLYEVVNG